MRLDAYGRERHPEQPGYGAAEHYDPHREAMSRPSYAEMFERWREKHCVKVEDKELDQCHNS